MASAQRGRKTADRVVSIDASPDAALLERVKGLKRGGARRAVHLHLSRLQQPNRRSEQLRIAGKPFESLFKAHDAELFSLTGGDIVFICKGARVAEIDDAVLQVRALFDKDPLTKGERQGRNSQFSTWYNLPKDYDAFLTAATALVEGPPPTQQPQGGAPAKAPKLKPIEPAMLAEIERVLANANLSKLMRRQLVCEISDDLPPQPVYRELYVSPAKAPKLKPIEPAMLAEIERVLANANLSKLMRRQLVCEISDDLPPQPVYRELYVSRPK